MNFRRRVLSAFLALGVAIGGSQALANQELFADLEISAQKARQLELIEPLDIRVVTRDEYRDEQAESFGDEALNEDTEDWNTLLIFLGFIGPDDNIIEFYQGFISEQVLGSYDPESHELIIVSTNTDEWNATDKTTFVHETVHALQDQHFDIMSVYGDTETITDDRYYAANSLIEGDATVAELIYITDNNLMGQIIDEYEQSDLAPTDDIPFFILETMMFPYDKGADFVLGVWQDGGWNAVNNLWTNPPTTSEQILHPEKYFDGEVAVPVAIADPQPHFGDDWRVIEDNEWGELGTRVFLENGGASGRDASLAAEGWGGDGVYVITNDDEQAMVWVTAWDTEDDAIEFLNVLTEAESNRLDVTADVVDQDFARFSDDGLVGEMQRDGNVVTYYLTHSEESLTKMQESQVGAELLDRSAPAPEATPATPVSKVAFWVRDN